MAISLRRKMDLRSLATTQVCIKQKEKYILDIMDQILLTVVLIAIFLAYLIRTFIVLRDSALFKFAYAITLITPPMSHLWHILYGEDRIRCEEENDTAFGWIPCFTPTWNNFVNTYEVTLVVENLFFCILTFYVLYSYRVTAAIVLNAILLALTIVLMFGSPTFLDDYTNIFDIAGFVISLLLLLAVEILKPKQPYQPIN